MNAPALAIVPARGGSKSIPRKNIRRLGHWPLLAYSIAAGQQARLVSRVIVSTDDPEIADLARALGAEVPFLRPPDLARDDTTDLPVFQHAVRWLEAQEGHCPDIIVQLRPTSPFRPAGCVDESIQSLLDHPEADSVRTVMPAGQNPYKMWRIGADGSLQPLLDSGLREAYNMPRQQLPATFWQTGHIDATRRRTLIEKNSMTGDHMLPLPIDPAFQMDLDNLLDWERAEWIVRRGHLDMVYPPAGGLADRLARVRLLVLDFDGVLTDNRVLVHQDGSEAVWCSRGDGWGIAQLRAAGVAVAVLSMEKNPVVAARCRKLEIQCVQGVSDKLSGLQALAAQLGLQAEQIGYVGNDVPDLPCLTWCGAPFSVADASAELRASGAWVTQAAGGRGAVREVCDMILQVQRG